MRDNRSATAGKPARPHHVAALKRADQIQKHVTHYAEDPRGNARHLIRLGVPRKEVAQIHRQAMTQAQRESNATKARFKSDIAARTAITAKIPGAPRGFYDRFTSDLIDAALYTPAGLYQAGKSVGGDVVSTAKGKPTVKGTVKLGKAVGKGVAQDFQHPLRHPGRVAIDIGGAVAPVAGGISRAAGTATALREGASVGKALTRSSREGGSLLHRPAPGRITHKIGDLKVETPASKNVIRRQAQRRRADYLNKHPEHPAQQRKVGAALQRQTHIEAQAAQAPSHLLAEKGAKLNQAQQMALRVVAEGKPVADRIKLHREQGAKATSAVERHDHAKQIRVLRRADKYIENVNGKPVIRADAPRVGAAYGHLKTADAQREAILRDTGQMTSAALESRRHAPGRVIEGARYEKTPAAKGRAEQVREYPARSKTVTRPRSEAEAKARLADLNNEYDAILSRVAEAVNPHDNPRAVQLKRNYVNSRLGKGKHIGTKRQPTVTQESRRLAENKLDVIAARNPGNATVQRYVALRDERTQLQDSLNTHVFDKSAPLPNVTETIPGKPRRVHLREVKAQKATAGLRGAEGFKGGEAYIPGFTTEPRLAGAAPSSSGTVVGQVRKIVSKNKPYTGEAMLHGKIPDNTTGLVARQTLRAVRYLQSDSFRQKILQAAHDERRSEHDILVNDRTLKTPAKLTPEAKAVLGKEKFTLDELSGHATAFEDFRRKLFPMAHKNDLTHLTPEERLAAQAGGKVKGYKWVDERLLRGANRPAKYASTKTAKLAVGTVDTINNASKLAILYLKPAYAAPNIGGNVFLNLVQQGFAAPKNIAKSVRLSHTIGDDAKAVALSVMGEGLARALESQHGLAQGAVNFSAGKWSKIIDQPFRLAALLHEADKLGYSTPEKLRALLLDEKHHADMLEAVQRANDEIIDYTRLPELGKDTIRRTIFFYPWVVGSTRYAGHFVAEHPVKAAVTANLAAEGKKKAGLGPVPSYERGAFKVGGKLVNPASAGIFGTAAQVVDTLQGVMHGHPTEAAKLSGFATPAVSLALANITREDSLGHPFPASYGLKDIAKASLFDSLPQVSLARRAKALGTDQGTKMFPVKNKWDVAGPFVVGGVGGRSYNQTTLNAQAKAETRSNLSPHERVIGDYNAFHHELTAAMRHHGEKAIPKEVAARLNLRVERATNRVQAAGGHKLDQEHAFSADLDLIVRHGWMKPAEANKAKVWAARAGKSDLTKASRYLTSNYFDRDGLLSDSLSYLRKNGFPDLKYPPLP